MGKMREASPYQLSAIESKVSVQKVLGFADLTPTKEDKEATTRTTTKARPSRLPHQKHGVDASLSPINNMGETCGSGTEKAHDLAMLENVQLVMSSGQVKILPTRIPALGQCAVIDWVNVTVHEETFCKTAGTPLFDPISFVYEASRVFESILGFGVTADNNKIINFYKNSWVLGDGFGFLCYGGQRDTLMLVLNGAGCLNAAEGWEHRLYQFLTSKNVVRPQITRVDLAHDDFESKNITPDWAENEWLAGNMSLAANAPNIEKRGNWHRPNGKGRTLYIGCRQSGKFARFYEKGKKEGDTQSRWTRAEIELKSSDRLIPLDIFLHPSDYFLGAYPCLAFLKSELTTPQRIKVKEKAASISFERSLEIVKTQCGKYITFLRKFFGDDELFLSKVSHPDPNVVPKRLVAPLKGLNTCTTFLHHFDYLKLTPEAVLAMPWDKVDYIIKNGKPTLNGGQWGLA